MKNVYFWIEKEIEYSELSEYFKESIRKEITQDIFSFIFLKRMKIQWNDRAYTRYKQLKIWGPSWGHFNSFMSPYNSECSSSNFTERQKLFTGKRINHILILESSSSLQMEEN